MAATAPTSSSSSSSSSSSKTRIHVEERIGFCEPSVVQICQTMPSIMNGHLSKTEWEKFCTKLDQDLKILTFIRTNVLRLVVVYLIIIIGLYVLMEVMDYLPGYRTLGLPVECAVLVALLVVLMVLYIVYQRYRVMRAVRRHCEDFTKTVCPTLRLTCQLPFCQCTGIAKGWYMDVATIITDSTREDHLLDDMA